MNPIIATKGLRKVFSDGNVVAVDSIDLTVFAGEIFGFLGPNGAGKTTTMRMLTTLLEPTEGIAQVCNFDLMTQGDKVRSAIGYVSQSGGLEASATARENFILQGRIFGMSTHEAEQRAHELIADLELADFADRLVSTYSGGQRRRADIALGMINRPRLLFLDEPTIALDPSSRARVWFEMKKLAQQGTTIFLTTHYLDEADVLCGRVAIVDKGTIVALDSPAQLKKEIGSDVIVIGLDQNKTKNEIEQLVSSLPGIREVIQKDNEMHFSVNNGESLLPEMIRLFDQAQIELTTISLHRPTLDDVFLKKTGRSIVQQNT